MISGKKYSPDMPLKWTKSSPAAAARSTNQSFSPSAAIGAAESAASAMGGGASEPQAVSPAASPSIRIARRGSMVRMVREVISKATRL